MDIRPGMYRHYKGGMYRVHGIAYLEATLEPHVVYEMLYDAPDFPKGTIWLRPVSVFFEDVELADGAKTPRFSCVKGDPASERL